MNSLSALLDFFILFCTHFLNQIFCRYLECGPRSGASTPAIERPVNPGRTTKAARRQLIPSSSRLLRDDEIVDLLNYEKSEEEVMQPPLVPHSTRKWLDELPKNKMQKVLKSS
ncbi:uncharacterized protein LOC114246872 [Bombyx mandarina]|uniref:Uncharacterized protein n=2 Tax=Bombyx TaxID=7090 RepID=A0A8R2HP77_BOMMO|nr:uncharacterized protein LOC110384914 [Bombyx mori]XP_028035398.1 uncharacterized protein LOC114246872 [Bombyx mandarina]